MTGVTFIDKQVGSRVRALRDASGVSIDEAAHLIGETWNEYCRLEAGDKRFKAKQLIALASKFGVLGSDFFEDFDAMDRLTMGVSPRPTRAIVH